MYAIDCATHDSSFTSRRSRCAPSDVLRKLWSREKELLSAVFGVLNTLKHAEYPTDCFFLEVLPVTAPRLRPVRRHAPAESAATRWLGRPEWMV